MDAGELKRILENAAEETGYSHFGWARFERPFRFEVYRQWIADGLHGEMSYLERHLPLKEEPSRFSPSARTAIVFAFPYRPHPEAGEFPLRAARIASYARGGDYHFWMKDRLRAIVERLRSAWPALEFEVHTDSSPLPERDLAARAGMGWIGRNGCAIHPKHGSFFLLGEILCSGVVDDAGRGAGAASGAGFAPLPDFCGTCRRCIEACPTDALMETRVMDARRCLSYLTIESRSLPPLELRGKWGDWFFGCDICQSVCPWNQKPFRPAIEEGFPVLPNDESAAGLEDELRWILSSSGKALERAFDGTALARTGQFGLKRNAILVAVNRDLRGLRPEIAALRDHAKLGELAEWALERWKEPPGFGGEG